MKYIPRALEKLLAAALARGKSVLLLGPRQTGKTTLLRRLPAALQISLVSPAVRQRYERNPGLLSAELEALPAQRKNGPRPLVILDEVQKVPPLLDVVQDAIDRKLAQFVLSGSSARQLRHGRRVNLLAGRLIPLHLDPFLWNEYPRPNLEQLLLFGSLPGIATTSKADDRETDLAAYVRGYLEEEIRAEAVVRNVASFSRFLELAGLESGRIVSFRALAHDLGIAHTTVSSYYEILEDCLVAERVDPISESKTRQRLTRSSRYLLFDLGVRRLAAGEGTSLHRDRLGELFEHFVGLELLRLCRLAKKPTRIRFWRDPNGPEVDWVLDEAGHYTPIEVKWKTDPGLKEARHLQVFLNEYPQAKRGYLVCRTPRRYQISPGIQALPWQELPSLLPL